MINSILLSILISLFSFNTQSATTITTEDGTAVPAIFYTNQSANTETLILTAIDSEGYHFANPDTQSGAFIPLSEASQYNLSNLKENNVVTIAFDSYGDIIKVNGKGVK